MPTFLDLQTEVAEALIDTPATVLARIPNLINQAIKELQRRHNFKVMEATTASTVTVGGVRNLIAVPADFKQPRGRPYEMRYDGTSRPLEIANDRNVALSGVIATTDIGYPLFLLKSEPNDAGAYYFEVYPLSDVNSDWVDGEYRIVIPYWRFTAPLVAAGSTNWFTENADRWIANKATAEGFKLEHDSENFAVWTQTAEIEASRVIKEDKLARVADTETLVPHRMGARSARFGDLGGTVRRWGY